MKKAFLVIALLAAVPSTSAAGDVLFDEAEADKPRKTSIYLYPFAEDVKWREIFQGEQVLEEEGERYGGGVEASFQSGESVYRLKGEYFQGTGDVTGSSSGIAWATEVKEFGFKAEGDGGWKVPVGRASIMPILGVGYRWWRREYQSSATVDELLEKWHAVYAKLGAAADFDIGGVVVPYVEAAVRIGIFTNVEIMYNGSRVSMNPGGRLTPYAEAGLKLSLLKGSVYYERIEFAQSDPAPAVGLPTGWGLVQPEVKENIFGARVGLSF